MFKELGRIKYLGLLIILFLQTPVFATSGIRIQINGVTQELRADEGKAYITQGTTMVPLAFVSKSLGHQTEWKASQKQVVIDNGKIVLTIANPKVFVDEKPLTLTIAPTIKNGRTYVPLRFVSTALGYDVDYKNNTVSITASITDGSGGNSGNSASTLSPVINMNQFAKDKGYEIEKQVTVDINQDGIKDYVAILTQSWEGYLFIVDGATGGVLAKQKIIPGEYGTSLEVHNIGGSYHIMCTAHDKQPWQGLYEWKNGKLNSHGDTLNEKFDVELMGQGSVEVKYPQSIYNQTFAISINAFRRLVHDMSWYPHSVGKIENNTLIMDKEIRLPAIDNSGHFQIIEKYNWSGTNWVLAEVMYNSYSDDFKKTDSNIPVKEAQGVQEWIAKGQIDTIPYKVGQSIQDVITNLGAGDPWTMQGIRIRTYGNYSINESLYDPIISGFTFGKGFKFYGITIGDSAKEIEAKLGKPSEKSDADEAGELSPDDTAYMYYYHANNNTLLINFDKNNRSTLAWFLAK